MRTVKWRWELPSLYLKLLFLHRSMERNRLNWKKIGLLEDLDYVLLKGAVRRGSIGFHEIGRLGLVIPHTFELWQTRFNLSTSPLNLPLVVGFLLCTVHICGVVTISSS